MAVTFCGTSTWIAPARRYLVSCSLEARTFLTNGFYLPQRSYPIACAINFMLPLFFLQDFKSVVFTFDKLPESGQEIRQREDSFKNCLKNCIFIHIFIVSCSSSPEPDWGESLPLCKELFKNS